MAAKRDYYEVLEISKDADGETITRSYRKLAMRFHPDRNPGDHEAEARFKEVAEAHEVLTDPEKRRVYDRYGHAGLEGNNGGGFPGGADFMDDLGEILGGFFGGRVRRAPRAGRDLQIAIEIDLLEAKRGTKKTVSIPREEACPDCSGSGSRHGKQSPTCTRCRGNGFVQSRGLFPMPHTCPGCGGRGVIITDPCPRCRGGGTVRVERQVAVPIYAGVDNDMMITLRGEGEAGGPGAPPGDLLCVVRVRPHPLFVRDGLNLHCEFPVTFSQAALGGPIEVPTLEGKFVAHTLKRGVQAGEEVRLSGQGIPGLRRDGRPDGRVGDLVVHVKVVTPRNLTKRQEELLRELAEIEGAQVSPERKSFLDRVREFFHADVPVEKSPEKPSGA
jgi:molecular chaperone DnaJ